MCVCGLSFLVGLPIHFYVLWLIVTGTESGVASVFFKLNLSVCEIGICVESLIFILSFCFSSLKKLICFLIGLAVTGRPLFQCLICVERYLAVVHPVTFLKYKPLRYSDLLCCSLDNYSWLMFFSLCSSRHILYCIHGSFPCSSSSSSASSRFVLWLFSEL